MGCRAAGVEEGEGVMSKGTKKCHLSGEDAECVELEMAMAMAMKVPEKARQLLGGQEGYAKRAKAIK
jgi:hypothetical protein